MSETMQPGAMEMTTNPEVKEVFEYTFIGRLGDLGLGSEGGIKSSLETESQVHEYAQKYVQCLVDGSADPSRVACVDGREGEGFEDDTDYVALDRTAGATMSDYVMAKASHSDVARNTTSDNKLDETDEIETRVGNTVGTVGKCSHGKGCGACNRAVDHLKSAAEAPAQAATKALVEFAPIAAVTGVTYDMDLASQAADGFIELATELEAADWDGNAYTKRAIDTNPRGVERLQGEASQPHHGHAENAIMLIADETAVPDEGLMKELGLGPAFAATVGRLSRVADALAGQRGIEGKTEAVISGLAWNVAVGSNLADPNMPIIVVWKQAA